MIQCPWSLNLELFVRSGKENGFKWSEWKPVTSAAAQTSRRQPAALLTIFRGHRAGPGLTESSVPGTECGGVDSAPLNPLKISLACGLRRGMVAVSSPLKDFIATFPEAFLCGITHCSSACLPD